MKDIRLDKLLANLGYGSRREVATMARAERIVLDGTPLTSADRRISLADAARLIIADVPIDPLPGLVLMIHKPVGMTCSHRESGPLVYDLLPDRWQGREPPLSSVGRLDKETSGLLLVTDDGALLHRIIAPRSHVPKRYRARLAEPVAHGAAALFASGTLRLDGETKPLLAADLEIVAPTEVCVTIAEGRYHQVRRMFAALGNHVVALNRQAIGGLDMPTDLATGEYRILTADEIARIFVGHAAVPASPCALSTVSRK